MPLVLLSQAAIAESYQRQQNKGLSGLSIPIRIKGEVTSGGKGIADVAVTDGLRITETDGDGSYELITDGRKPFVYITIPAGYKIPTNPTGTARFYERIEVNSQGEARISFELEQREVDGQNHHFLLLADPQTQNNYEVERFHSETVPDISNLVKDFSDKPVFGLGCGDLMFDNLELFPEYEMEIHTNLLSSQCYNRIQSGGFPGRVETEKQTDGCRNRNSDNHRFG